VSVKALLRRVKRWQGIGQPPFDPGDCPQRTIGAVVVNDQPEPPAECVKRCPTCGGRHVLRIRRVVVRSRDEV